MRQTHARAPRLATILVPIVGACAAPGPVPGPAGAGCIIPSVAAPAPSGSHDARAPDSIRVALAHPVDPARAPAARDASERSAFRPMYETLVEVDCEGRIRAGLATSWTHDGGGRLWRFGLRPDARFWDGTAVTAEAVARSWLAASTPEGAGAGTPRIASVTVAGELELLVDLSEPTTAPERFARTEMAVTGLADGGAWPLGSGPFRPVADGRDPTPLRLVPRGGGAPILVFRITRGEDARAALDAGADVVVSADPAVMAYARTFPDLTVVPLPWSRTYVLAAARAPGGAGPLAPVPAEALDGLARGAVRAEARPARAPLWWTARGCGFARATPSAGDAREHAATMVAHRRPAARVVYPTGDATARGIAERLVALSGPGVATPAWLTAAVPDLAAATGSPVSVALDATSLARAARTGDALAFVVPLPRAPGGPCTSELLAAEDEIARAVLDPAAGVALTPLLDVRASVVLRRGVTGLWIDGDGTLRFGGVVPGGGERSR